MDDCDLTDEREAVLVAAKIRESSGDIAPGVPGDCDLCGEHSGRLIGGACAPCRDKYRLP